MPRGIYKRTKEYKKLLSVAQKKVWKEGRSNGFKKGEKSKNWNGFKQGHTINIGRHPTKETLIKMSKSQTGHKVLESQRKAISKTLTKGGHINQFGYRIISIEGKRYKEHQVIWIRHNQIPIPKGFAIHHRDMNKINNDINNLVLLPNGLHTKLHNTYKKVCASYVNQHCNNIGELWSKRE